MRLFAFSRPRYDLPLRGSRLSDARRRNGGPPRKEVAGAENEPSLSNEGADHQPEPSGLGGVGRSSIIVYYQKMM